MDCLLDLFNATNVIAAATVVYTAVAILQLKVYQEQKRIAARNLKIALYDKRLTVFRALMTFMASVVRDADVSNSQLAELLRDSAEMTFLFPPEINDYLHAVYSKGNALHTSNFKLKGTQYQEPGEARTKLVDESSQLLDWFIEEQKAATEKFRPYIDFADI